MRIAFPGYLIIVRHDTAAERRLTTTLPLHET
jgi:hypothetical protein